VQLDVKELSIYLIKHFGLEEKARASACEISITVDGAHIDDYCIHGTCGFKMTYKYARDPLHIDHDDYLKRGKLLLPTIQSSKNAFPITSIILKDSTSTYNKFLRHIFEFGQELRDVGIPELRWKPLRVSEPQNTKSSQLCMHRGGAAQQIPYFCHLCQKHSDDIAHPNQTVCDKCARICDKGCCYHYPMMDADMIQKLLEKKNTLATMDEAQRLTFVCEQLYGGDWDAHYAACDLHLVSICAKVGVMDVPDENLKPNKYATYLENIVATVSMLGLVIAPKTSLKSKRNSIIRALHIMRKYAHYHDAFTFGESVKGSYSKAENEVPCVLHLHKRVIENVLTLLFTRSFDELASEGK
jgi:hypothetical protein